MRRDLSRYAAVNACARALLAQLIGRAGLEALLACPSAAAVVAALQRTAYGALLPAGVAVERAVAERVAVVGRTLLRTVDEPARGVLALYLLHHEIDNLRILLRGLHAGLPAERLHAHLLPLAGVGTLDPASLARSGSIPALVERLDGTPYAPPLRHALPQWRVLGPFALEIALERDYCDRLWSAAASLPPADRRIALDLLGVLYDIVNLAWIARYRQACGLSAAETLAYTLRQGRWLTAALRKDLAADASGREWPLLLRRTPYGAILAGGHAFDSAAIGLSRFLAEAARAACTGYPFHIGVPLGCLLACDIEVRDLQRILAARRLAGPGAPVPLASVRR